MAARIAVLASLLCVFALAGCAGDGASSDTPEQAVSTYVEARESGDSAKAQAMLTTYASEHGEFASASEKGIRNLSVAVAEPMELDDTLPAHWSQYADVRRVIATYGTSSDEPGITMLSTSESIIVVKETPESPWRIEDARSPE